MSARSTGRLARAGALAALALLLAGCEGEQDELRGWMDQTRRDTPVIREKIAEPKSFEPYRYQSAGAVEPFSLMKLRVGLPVERGGSGVKPDTERRREALEAYPLDSLKMVGNLVQAGQVVALVQADRLLFQVRVGNHVGLNFGRVMRVSEDQVSIKEIVQDAAGDWIERDSALKLQVQESGK
ncbi:MAG: hypothetical protein RJA99_4138 [Pseudomonadota bacterium]|jgi:type IV pilus assembly protein PilP